MDGNLSSVTKIIINDETLDVLMHLQDILLRVQFIVVCMH